MVEVQEEGRTDSTEMADEAGVVEIARIHVDKSDSVKSDNRVDDSGKRGHQVADTAVGEGVWVYLKSDLRTARVTLREMHVVE